MKFRLVLATLQLAQLLVICIALDSRQSHKANTSSSIEFSRIPPAAQGGRESRYDHGRVRNARPGQQIVIYTHSGPWWVRPWPDRPFARPVTALLNPMPWGPASKWLAIFAGGIGKSSLNRTASRIDECVEPDSHL